MISAAIIGGSGYTGKYLIKFLNEHPHVKHIFVYANKSSGKAILEIFPELQNEVNNIIVSNINDLSIDHDVYFFALPHGESLKYIPSIIKSDKWVIDLGADFRLDSSELFTKTYGLDHPSPELLNRKVYGLSEFAEFGNDIKLVANPGCYPTAALLSLLPLVKSLGNEIINISTSSYSGLSGAGKKASVDLIFAENYNSVKAYNVGTHRHEIEIKQELGKFNENPDYSLTTHLLPLFSGIYSTTICFLNIKVYQDEIMELFTGEYDGKTFIRLRDTPPELKWIINTNYCDINVKVVNNKILITAAIDNLIKGASGQAIQNMNRLLGWNELLGVKSTKESHFNIFCFKPLTFA